MNHREALWQAFRISAEDLAAGAVAFMPISPGARSVSQFSCDTFAPARNIGSTVCPKRQGWSPLSQLDEVSLTFLDDQR